MRARVVLVTLAALAVLAAGAWWVLRDSSTAFERAMGTLPEGTQRATFTDWSYAAATVGTSSVEELVEAAYDADLTRTSAIEDTAAVLEDAYGLSVDHVAWEAYGQSDDGSVDVLRVEDVSFTRLAATLRRLDYAEPSDQEGVWTGTPNVVATIDPSLSPVMQNLVLLEDEGLVLLSDDTSYAEAAADAARGDGATLTESAGELAARAGDPVSGVLWAGDRACSSLSMSAADTSDQDLGEQLVEEAGGVDPLSGLAMARQRGGHVTVAMEFESGDQAEDNLQPRTDLAAGDAPGLGGAFSDRFKVTDSRAEGDFVVLDLAPSPDEDALLTGISNGPVLFATC